MDKYQYLELAICILGLFTVVSADPRRQEVIDFMKRENFLKRCQRQGKSVDQCITDVKRYCQMLRPSRPGIDEELIACIRKPKCGHPIISDPDEKEGYINYNAKYNKNHLKYYLQNNAKKTKLTMNETWNAVDMSVAVWACHSNLTFSRATSEKDADIFVGFKERYHGYVNYYNKLHYDNDGSPFDGPGGILAHAFYPTSATTGNFHYDDEETYIEHEGYGIKILHVTVHELGHNLGIAHIERWGNIMYPMYDPSYHETQLDLGRQDIYEIQGRYGSKDCLEKVWQEYYENKYIKKPTIECLDKSNDCEKFTYSECLSDRNWMSENCASHCGYCGNCTDLYEDCKHWPGCNPIDPWFVTNCKAHCGFCAAKEVKSIYAVRTKDSQAKRNTICGARRIDGIFQDSAKFLYFITNGMIYRQDPIAQEIDPDYELNISNLGIEGLSKPSAASFDQTTKSLYLLEGGNVFVIRDILSYKPSSVKRYSLPSSASSPEGAFITGDREPRQLSVIKSGAVITLQFIGDNLEIIKTELVQDLFENDRYASYIPHKIDGVYQQGRKLHFFLGSSVLTAMKQKNGRYLLQPEGIIPFMTAKLKCPVIL